VPSPSLQSNAEPAETQSMKARVIHAKCRNRPLLHAVFIVCVAWIHAQQPLFVQPDNKRHCYRTSRERSPALLAVVAVPKTNFAALLTHMSSLPLQVMTLDTSSSTCFSSDTSTCDAGSTPWRGGAARFIKPWSRDHTWQAMLLARPCATWSAAPPSISATKTWAPS